MSTPTYDGNAQPVAPGGWLAGLGAWFGGAPPSYAGDGQPRQAAAGVFGATTPAYKQAPAPEVTSTDDEAQTSDDACATQPEQITVLIPRELIEKSQK